MGRQIIYLIYKHISVNSCSCQSVCVCEAEVEWGSIWWRKRNCAGCTDALCVCVCSAAAGLQSSSKMYTQECTHSQMHLIPLGVHIVIEK